MEFDRRFGKRIIEHLKKRIKGLNPDSVLMVAPSRMLGIMGHDLKNLPKYGPKIIKVQKDMTKFHPMEIHNHLAKEGLLPPYVNPKKK
jgi:protein required for attachment to host cells